MLKYHKKKLEIFFQNALYKESTVPKHLVFLLLLQHFLQKHNLILTLGYQYPCKNIQGLYLDPLESTPRRAHPL